MNMGVSDSLVRELIYLTNHGMVAWGFRKLLVEFKSADIGRRHAVEVA